MSIHVRHFASVVLGCALALACSRPDASEGDTARADIVSRDSAPAPSATPAQAATGDAPTILPSGGQLACLVTDSSMGPVRLGMTLAEARAALPTGTRFSRGYDGEGVGSVDVVVGSDSLMSIVADGDEDEAIDWSKRITFLETYSPACRTADGVHPRALVTDVQKVLGKPTKVMMSEIESRQFITFERQPERITFRLDYTGIFDEGSRETVRVEPQGKIFSISIASWGR